MKSKLLGILMFAIVQGFGQSVPNSSPVKLLDVQAVVGHNNLVDCFTNSNAAYFDATYGSKTMSPKALYGFRNYGPKVCVRPGGLSEKIFINRITRTINGTPTLDYFYANGFTAASLALYDFAHYLYNPITLHGAGPSTGWMEASSFAVGDTVYVHDTSPDCTVLANGWYISDYSSYPTNLYLIQSGVITEITMANLLTHVVTSEYASIASTTISITDNQVVSQGGSAVTERGVAYNTTGSPTLANSHTSNGTGTGLFDSYLTGLSPSTLYYVRAYATNSYGTGYGNEMQFTTDEADATLATVTTSVYITNLTDQGADAGGDVTADGGASVTAKGVVYATTTTPTLANDYTNDGTGTGSFASSMFGLTEGTTYYYRAYATNSAGTSYGDQNSFKTKYAFGYAFSSGVTGDYFKIFVNGNGTPVINTTDVAIGTLYLDYNDTVLVEVYSGNGTTADGSLTIGGNTTSDSGTTIQLTGTITANGVVTASTVY